MAVLCKSEVAIVLCLDHKATWEFSWICSISAEHLSVRYIWGTTSVSLTQDSVSPITYRLLCYLYLIVGYEGIAIMIATDVIPLVPKYIFNVPL